MTWKKFSSTFELKICLKIMLSALTLKKTLHSLLFGGARKIRPFTAQMQMDASHLHSGWKFAMGITETSWLVSVIWLVQVTHLCVRILQLFLSQHLKLFGFRMKHLLLNVMDGFGFFWRGGRICGYSTCSQQIVSLLLWTVSEIAYLKKKIV